MGLDESLTAMLEPVVSGLGCRLWGVEYRSGGRHAALKVYIDGISTEVGVNVDDCARVSRQISSLLDVEDPIPGNYTLEVSSPGLDRRLFSREHYEEFVGSQVKVSLKYAFDGRKRYAGMLSGIEGKDVVLRINDEEEYLIPLEQIDRTTVVPEL